MLNKLVLRVLLSLSLAFSIAGTANATLISQDILLDSYVGGDGTYEVIGNVAIDLDIETADIIGDIAYISEWASFSFYGYEVDAFDSFSYFEAVVDMTNIYQGIEFLAFDVTLFTDLSFGGYIDIFEESPSLNYSFFDNSNADLYDYGNVMFGEANVASVPVPATIVLFLTGLFAMVVRRKYN